MLVSICSTLMSFTAQFLLTASSDSKITGIQRRVSRVKTLDGGVASSDQGFTWADASIELVFTRLTVDQIDNLNLMAQSHPVVTVSHPEGFFHCVVSSVSSSSDKTTLKLFINSRVA